MTLITIRIKKNEYFSALPTHESSEGEQVLLPQIYAVHLVWRKCRSFQWNLLLLCHSTDSFAIVPVLTLFLFQAVQSIYMKYSNYALRASPCNFQRAKHTQLASSTNFQAWYLGKSSLHFLEYSGSGYTTNIPLTSVQLGGGGGVLEEWSTPVNTIHERTCWLDERFQILDSNNAQLSEIDPSSDVFERHMNSFGERMFSQKTANYKTTKKSTLLNVWVNMKLVWCLYFKTKWYSRAH